MGRVTLKCLIVSVVLSVGACGNEPLAPMGASVVVRLDSVAAPAIGSRRYLVHVVNAGDRAIDLLGCERVPTYRVERLRNGRWEAFDTQYCDLTGLYDFGRGLPFVVPPRDSATTDVLYSRPGTFRVAFDVAVSGSAKRVAIASRPFVIP